MSNIFTRILKKVQAVNPKQVIVTERVFRTVSTRKLRRQALKNQQGNNHIRAAWNNEQAKLIRFGKMYAIANGSKGGKRRRMLNKINRAGYGV